MMKLKLPILFNTDSTAKLSECDLDFDLKDCEVREVIFYNFDAIALHKEGGNDYTTIYTSSCDFICPLPVSEVELIIEKSKVIEYITN